MARREKRSTQSAASSHSGKAPIQDLREWLDRVDAIGELVRVREPVDWDEEMGAITYLVAKQNPSPAVLFESTKGYESSPVGAGMLWNILGPSFRRIALTLEESPDTLTLDLVRRVKDKLRNRIPPNEILPAQAPIYENSKTGADVDLSQLPIPKHWPLDGGRYAGTGASPSRLQLPGASIRCSWLLALRPFQRTCPSTNSPAA
jgi:4-hydroxy-3-polyprenylbenzoate decarboxylase